VLASDFDFVLPPELIAQVPLVERDGARLFVLDRGGANSHRQIVDLPSLLPPNALLVVNDTRVIPARLRAEKLSGGRVEILLCDPVAAPSGDARQWWRCMCRSSKTMRPGPLRLFGERPPTVEVIGPDTESGTEGAQLLAFTAPPGEDFLSALERLGEIPLPPYIERQSGPSSDEDRARYQTVFAAEPGAVAAPTAGLHFTPSLLAALDARAIERVNITLHVGPGTFAPLRSDDLDAHRMHAERYHIPPSTAVAVNRARAAGRPVVAVGTTVVRALETAASDDGLSPGWGQTRLFLRPGAAFRIVDALLTNFHLPKSTLLMLVSAFVGSKSTPEAGISRVLAAYAEAVAERYRFFSYGDAMLIK